MLGPTSLGFCQLFEVGVKFLRRGFRHMCRKHGIGMSRREATSRIGRSCLDQHRPPLGATRYIEGPGDRIKISPVLDRPDAVGLCIKAGGAVVDHGVGRPAVPQVLYHLHEFFTAGIAVGMTDLSASAIVFRRSGEPGRHDIPGSAAFADVIDRGELASEVERFRVGGRGRRDQSDPLRYHCDRGQYGDRLKPGARRLRDITSERELIRKKDRIEQRRLGALRQIPIIIDIGQCQRR